MDFAGIKKATLDEKGRVVLPAEFKKEMGGSVPGGRLAVELDPYERCLNIYPVEEWNKRLSSLKGKLNLNNMEHTRMLDLIYQRFKIIDIPGSCRMSIPRNFIESVHLSKEIIFTGQGTRFRLWDAGEYHTYMDSMGDFRSNFSKIFGQSI